MSKFLGLFWSPGSAGDLIQSIILSDQRYIGFFNSFKLSTLGNITSKKNYKLFEKKIFCREHLYSKIWKNYDLLLLEKISKIYPNKTILIPTHRLSNIFFFKNKLKNFKSIGVSYTKSMFPIVLKNFCKKKIADKNWQNTEFIKKNSSQFDQYFKEKKFFKYFFFKKILRNQNNFLIEKHVCNDFDYNINLEEIYTNKFITLKKLINFDQVKKKMIADWISKQSVIHRYDFSLSQDLKTALGFNPMSNYRKHNLDVKLDIFDNILLKNYFKNKLACPVPTFNDLAEAINFFNSINNSHGTD